MSETLSMLSQQLMEIGHSVRILAEVAELRHNQAEKLNELVRGDLTLLRSEQRDLEDQLYADIRIIRSELEGLRAQTVSSASAVESLIASVGELRRPVTEMLTLRSRLAGIIIGVGFVGSAVIGLAEPIYRWVIEHHMFRQ